MTASLGGLFIHFPALSVTASAEFALVLSAVSAILLAIYFSDQPQRKANLKWLAIGAGIFIAYSLILSMPKLVSGAWTEAWGMMAWLGRSVCMAILLTAATAAIVCNGHIDTELLRKLLAISIMVSLVIHKFPTQAINELLPYDRAHDPIGLFYSTRIAAFWCVIGMALSMDSSLVNFGLFGIGLMVCKSTVAWIAATGIILAYSESLILSILIAITAISATIILNPHAIDYAFLRFRNYAGVLSTILSHPFGIGSDPFAYAKHMGNRNLLPHPASDVLNVILQHGWLATVGIFMAMWSLAINAFKKPTWVALFAVSVFACIQSSLHHPHNLMLAWFVLCAWLIEENKQDAAWTPKVIHS